MKKFSFESITLQEILKLALYIEELLTICDIRINISDAPGGPRALLRIFCAPEKEYLDDYVTPRILARIDNKFGRYNLYQVNNDIEYQGVILEFSVPISANTVKSYRRGSNYSSEVGRSAASMPLCIYRDYVNLYKHWF